MRSIQWKLLFLFLFASFGVPTTFADPADDNVAAFGETKIAVQSVQAMSVAGLNERVKRGVHHHEAWTQQAILAALKVAGEEIKGGRKSVVVESPGERFDTAVVTITESGFLDDSVVGQRYRFWLEKDPSGMWLFHRALWAHLCSRSGQEFYSAENCP